MIEAELHVTGGKHLGQVIPLNRRKFLIGREQDCQLRPSSELVSRHHCVFSIDEFAVRLRDLGSTNGTSVNGERLLKDVTLAEGDHVVVGNLEFEFRVTRSSANEADGKETVVAGTETVAEFAVPDVIPNNSNHAVVPEPVRVDQHLQAPDDTTVIANNMVFPGQVPYQPMMPQPMGYPGQMYGGYPYQGQPPMPMYPPGYPQVMMPGSVPAAVPGHVLPTPPLGNQPATGAQAVVPGVTLPEPSDTGVAPAEVAQTSGKKGSGGGQTESTNAADAIIKQYTQRRPA